MKSLLRSRPWRSLLLLAGAASLVVLSSCMDQSRDPVAPDLSDPQFVIWSLTEPCAATGTANVNGYVDEPAWSDACAAPFEADLTGSRTTTVIARFMNDGSKAYFSAASNAPFSNPNSVLRIFLQKGTGQIHAIGIAGNTATQWTCSSFTDCEEPQSGPAGATAFRQNYSGGTAYEIGWPLTALGFGTGDVVAVRWETIPGGESAQPTLYPAAEEGPLLVRISGTGTGDDNDSALPDIVITTDFAATVTIRNPEADPFVDPTAFQCKIAQPNGSGKFTARFNDLPEGTRWVGTAGNKKTCNHLIWPPLDPEFEPDFAVPGQQGAVFIESAGSPLGGSSAALTWTNWLTAKGNAIPLTVSEGEGEIRQWYIEFQGPGRPATCTAFGTGNVVYVLEDGRGRGVPESLNQPPPGLAITYARKTACTLTGLPNVPLILQMRNQDGGESTGFLDMGQDRVFLFPQSDLFGSTVITDPAGDGSPVDLLTLRYGQVQGLDGELTGAFSIMVGFQGWNARKSEAQVEFEIILDGVQTIKVTAFYGVPRKGAAAGWYLTTVQPDRFKDNVSLGQRVDATAAGGSVELLLSGLTFNTMQIRARSNLAGGSQDFVPNSGYASWPGDNGGSFASPF